MRALGKTGKADDRGCTAAAWRQAFVTTEDDDIGRGMVGGTGEDMAAVIAGKAGDVGKATCVAVTPGCRPVDAWAVEVEVEAVGERI